MTALAEYLLKANLCLAVFYALYYLLLRRHTFFILNRVYLMLALALSFGLPLISLPEPVVETVSLPMINLPVVMVATQPTGPTIEEILLAMYGMGALLFLTLLVVSLGRLMQLIRSGTAMRQSDHTLVLLPDERIAPFSFFRYLVLNTTDFGHHADPILRHELAHIRQWHSVDVLLAELVKVVCWPNPVAWFYKWSLQQVHEYLADQQAADKEQYARFLFSYAFEGSTSPVTNSFFTPAMLTQRIRMLYQSRTTNRVLWKYALALPLLILLVGLTAAREPIRETLASQPGKTITVSGRVEDATGKPLAGATVMDGHQVTTTDNRGHYTLTKVSSPAKVMFGYAGLEPRLQSLTHGGTLNVRLKPLREELPTMGATANYKAVGINKDMPVTAQPLSQTINGEVFTQVEQQPAFPDGIPGLMYYIAHNLKYPVQARLAKVQGKVFVKFVVTASGAVQSTRVIKGIGYGCDEEAMRVVNAMPKWTPGKQNGVPVDVEFVLPIQFALEGSKSMTIIPGDKPLVIMDGIVQDKSFDLNTINPNDIESITRLKEAAAQPYGEKGKNGVIIITTKTKKP